MAEDQLKILIVDDDQVIRKFLMNALKVYGQCDVACDGQEGVSMYARSIEEKAVYDLVIMDIMMPNMDGMEATERITSLRDEKGIDPEESRVVMLSCIDDGEHFSMAQFEAGADGYLTKPVELKHLREALLGMGLIAGGPDHAKS